MLLKTKPYMGVLLTFEVMGSWFGWAFHWYCPCLCIFCITFFPSLSTVKTKEFKLKFKLKVKMLLN